MLLYKGDLSNWSTYRIRFMFSYDIELQVRCFCFLSHCLTKSSSYDYNWRLIGSMTVGCCYIWVISATGRILFLFSQFIEAWLLFSFLYVIELWVSVCFGVVVWKLDSYILKLVWMFCYAVCVRIVLHTHKQSNFRKNKQTRETYF